MAAATAIASAPQKATRSVGLSGGAPPSQALSAPSAARKTIRRFAGDGLGLVGVILGPGDVVQIAIAGLGIAPARGVFPFGFRG